MKTLEFTIEDFKEINRQNNILGSYENKGPYYFKLNEKLVEKNFAIAQERQLARDNYKPTEPAVGDIIYLPQKKKVIISHVWDNHVQTSRSGSCHIGKSGYMSYSGGLDSGLKREDLFLSEEKDFTQAWFFEGDWASAHSAVYFNLAVKVWKVRKGADLSGVTHKSDR